MPADETAVDHLVAAFAQRVDLEADFVFVPDIVGVQKSDVFALRVPNALIPRDGRTFVLLR